MLKYILDVINFHEEEFIKMIQVEMYVLIKQYCY